MYLLYSALLAAGMVLALPFWLWQMFRHGKYRTGFGERWGGVPERILKQSTKPAIWIHAVSVGEVLAVSGLIEQMKAQLPGYRLIVSTTTDSGQKLARTRFGEENVFYFPLDFAFAIRPYLQQLRPALVVLAETEFWPNFLRLSRRSGARLAVINARISDRSLPGYRRFRPWLQQVLEPIEVFLAQTEEDKKRLIEIGADTERVQVSGNLKFDAPELVPPAIISRLRAALQSANAGPVLVCGSTVEGEERMLLDAFSQILAAHPKALIILAPRHPERFPEVEGLLKESKLRFWWRSRWNGEPISGGVFLLDTIGELAGMYALADVAFVGGSLVPRGGHNILEPARYGVPIFVGQYTENFRDIIELFRARDAVRVTSPYKLASDFMALVTNDAERKALGQRAAETLSSQLGATQRTLDALRKLLETKAA
jgi:3-deoxy-D-manno-octulosonic-acid transferase